MEKPHYILTFQCKDQPGIIATITAHLLTLNCNIIHADQYSSTDHPSMFFMRVEFDTNWSDTKHFKTSFQTIADQFNATWSIKVSNQRPKVAILVSKATHCLHELIHQWVEKDLNIDIQSIVSNHPLDDPIIKAHDLPFHYVPVTKTDKKEDAILDIVKGTDLIILARYMQVLSASFIDKYGQDIINIHHSFLPSFKGANPYQQAYDRGVKMIGATAHFVTPALDEGPIISQSIENVSHQDTTDTLKHKGKHLEKVTLANAVNAYSNQKVFKNKDRTVVFS